jgi:hypothetical protein
VSHHPIKGVQGYLTALVRVRDWRPMTTYSFLVTLGLGSAFIGFWVAIRFPDRAPEDFRRALIHVVAALAAGWIAPFFTAKLFPLGFAAAMTALFAVLMPVLVYTFLSGAWVVKLAQERIGQHR